MSPSNNSQPFHSLGRRIVWQFCFFTFALSLIYGVITLSLLYTLEDSFIERELQEQSNFIVNSYHQTGHWQHPIPSNMQLIRGKASLPAEIRQRAIKEPQRHEFSAGNGLHYHLLPLPGFSDSYLLAEVSDRLLVRPIRDQVLRFLYISSGVVTLIACLLAYFVGKRTSQPVTRLAKLVHGVAPQDVTLGFSSSFPNNEIGQLATTLEDTLARMSAALEREKCFTQDVSHELRTPLTIIQNAVEVLLQQNIAADASPALIRIRDAAEKMRHTVNTLLILAREIKNTGAAELTQLRAIVERAVLDNCSLLDDKPVEVVVDNSCDTVIQVNPGMLKVLLDNLLSNAFQYTSEGQVTIRFQDNRLFVTDTGPGIDPGICPDVLSAGIRGKNSTGFGFGLSIVSRLCEHQGWQIWVNSQQGTQVAIRFN